jgi:prepilin-type N-terminal cleavage/methylation domain-containing protein
MKKGFTLIELIAVMAIVGVLSIMIVPNVIKLLNGSMEDTMKITENEVVDAANLYVEDYCRNPINDEYRDNCLVDKKTINESKIYFCLSTLQGRKMIKEVYFKESTSCKGIVTYDYENYKYFNPKAYLYCGESYETEGGSTYKIYADGC